MRRPDEAIASVRRLAGACSDHGCFPQIPCFREFLREFLKNVREEAGKTNDYRTYFNPKFKEQGILGNFGGGNRRRIRVALRYSSGAP